VAVSVARKNVEANGVSGPVVVSSGSLKVPGAGDRLALREGFLRLRGREHHCDRNRRSCGRPGSGSQTGRRFGGQRIIEERNAEAREAIERAGLSLIADAKEGDWHALVAEKAEQDASLLSSS